MPSHIRVFWWLTVAVVTYWVCMSAWHQIFPAPQQLAGLARLPAQEQEAWRLRDILAMSIQTLVSCAVTLGLAWLTAFRRLNWARWAFAAVFLIRESLPFSVFFFIDRRWLDVYLGMFVREISAHPLNMVISYIPTAVLIVAIGFVFSGNARDWFEARPAPAVT